VTGRALYAVVRIDPEEAHLLPRRPLALVSATGTGPEGLAAALSQAARRVRLEWRRVLRMREPRPRLRVVG
jgi:hypothetical protein